MNRPVFGTYPGASDIESPPIDDSIAIGDPSQLADSGLAFPQPGEDEPRRRLLVRFAASLALAAGVSALVFAVLPSHLSGKTTVVGYPIYADFDVNRYLDIFYLVAIAFPLLALGIYHALCWRGPLVRRSARRHRPRASTLANVAPEEPGDAVKWLTPLGRSAFVGGVLALEGAIALGGSGGSTTGKVLLGAAAYVLVLIGVAGATRKLLGGTWSVRLAQFNSLGALATISLLAVVSEHTVIVVTGHGTEHFSWFPAWLAGAAALVGIVIAKGAERRLGLGPGPIERGLVTYVAGSVAIFLVLAFLPSQLGPMDTFAEGEYLAGAWLILHGAMPWRDLYMIHGLLDDGLKAMVGFAVFGDSRWGATAGITMFVTPAYFVATYLFAAYTFARRWAVILAVAVAITCGIFVDWDPRYLCWPLVLIAFVAALRRRSPLRSVVLALALVGQTILVPEMALAIIALGATVILFELYERPPGRFAWSQFPLTAWTGGGGVVISGLFAVYLAATHALSGFIGYFEDFATAHSLTGGIPIWTNYAVAPQRDQFGVMHYLTAYGGLFSRYTVELYLPVLCVLITDLLVVARLRGGRPLTVEDWLAVGTSLMVLLYYQKALSRGDNAHIGEVFAVTTPLVMVLVFRVVTLVENRVRRARADRVAGASLSRRRGLFAKIPYAGASVGLLVVALVAAPTSPASLLDTATPHFRAASTAPPVPPYQPGLPSLGYASPDALPDHLVAKLGAVFDRYAGARGAVFDFSDAPGVVDFLLGRSPGSRFYDISLAITPEAQQLVIDDLQQSHPKLVLWNGVTGLPVWDFIENEVRQYLVADYILDHYRPLTVVDHELVLIADGAGPAATTASSGLYFSTAACAWGNIPNFLSDPPSSPGTTVAVQRVARVKGATLYRFTLPPGSHPTWITVTRSDQAAPGEITVTNSVPHDTRDVPWHDITWVADKGTAATTVEVGSCLQWHGFGRDLFVRYRGPGSIQSVAVAG